MQTEQFRDALETLIEISRQKARRHYVRRSGCHGGATALWSPTR